MNEDENNLIVLTSVQGYVLSIPLKESFQKSIIVEFNLPNNPKPNYMAFLTPHSLMYFDKGNHLYFKSDIRNNEPPLKVWEDPIQEATILDSKNAGMGRDWVIVRSLDDYSGYLYRIYNWTAMVGTNKINRDNVVYLGIN